MCPNFFGASSPLVILCLCVCVFSSETEVGRSGVGRSEVDRSGVGSVRHSDLKFLARLSQGVQSVVFKDNVLVVFKATCASHSYHFAGVPFSTGGRWRFDVSC